jgi:hypothetical protein
MGYYDLAREARFEFRRVTVASLLASAERELDRHRAAGHRMRTRRAERRIRELRRSLVAPEGSVAPPQSGAGVVAAFTATWLVTVSGLAVAVVRFGLHGVTAVADVAMVAATVAWFAAIVLRAPRPADEPEDAAGPEEEARSQGWVSLVGHYHGGRVSAPESSERR